MWGWSVAVAASASVLTVPSHNQDTVTAFVNVSVIPMDRERVLTGQTLLVQNGRITALGPAGTIEVPVDANRIDGEGKYLIPGLGDMHAHLSLTPIVSSDSGLANTTEPVSPDEIRVAERRLMTHLAMGVTTIRNMSGLPWHLSLRERAASGELLSPRIYTAGPAIGDIPTAELAKKIVADHKAAGYDFLKVRPISIAPEVLEAFAAAADRAGMRFVGHVSPSVGLERMLRLRPASIEHLMGFMYIIAQISPPFGRRIKLQSGAPYVSEAELPAVAAATRRAGVWNCPTLVQSISRPGSTDSIVLALHPKIVKALHAAGAGLLAGTDAVNGKPTIVDELTLFVAAGLTPYQALETGTRNVAAFFGTQDSTGTVTVGKRADLVLLQNNPLQDIGNAAQPLGVMLGGRWLPRTELDARLAALKDP